MAFVSAFCHVCEKVLLERDGIPTLVRMVDIFYVPEKTALMPDGTRLPIAVSLYAEIKVTPDDTGDHQAAFRITRPDGSEKTVDMPPQNFNAGVMVPDAPKALRIVAQMGVEPTHYGKHEISLVFDGKVAASAPFFILLPPSEAQTVPAEN